MDLWKPLPIYALDHDSVDMARIKQAKLALWLDYTVVPKEQHDPTAFERVLAWGHAPAFPCEYALVDDRTSDADLEKALAWVLSEGDGDDRTMTFAEVLSLTFGPGVREIPEEELMAEKRLHDYQTGAA